MGTLEGTSWCGHKLQWLTTVKVRAVPNMSKDLRWRRPMSGSSNSRDRGSASLPDLRPLRLRSCSLVMWPTANMNSGVILQPGNCRAKNRHLLFQQLLHQLSLWNTQRGCKCCSLMASVSSANTLRLGRLPFWYFAKRVLTMDGTEWLNANFAWRIDIMLQRQATNALECSGALYCVMT